MADAFNPEIIRAQIATLVSQRDRIDRAIRALESALENIEGVSFQQDDLGLADRGAVTLHDAVKQVCQEMVDGITRQRVITAIERKHPFLKPKSPSVAASLINLTKGNQPMLRIAIEGRGRSPSLYSTEGETRHQLSSDEAKELLNPGNTHGTGGWQSLFHSLQKNFDKATGEIRLTTEQRGRIYQYYHYGSGGWQEKVKRIFRRELPHLFLS